MTLTRDYSGIILSQNALSTSTYEWQTVLGGNWVYQTFTLPTDYQRGTGTEARVPDLSGFQVMTLLDEEAFATATLNYKLDYYEDGDGWLSLTSGQVTGAPLGGRVWLDAIFPESVPIAVAQLGKEFRFGIQTVDTSASLPYVSPTPLLHRETGQGQLYLTDGVTPLLSDITACLNFRILALVADNGSNFLGNEYRSCVIQTAAGNVSTTAGDTPVTGTGASAYWLSPPMPSRFAVQSLYFDMRSSLDEGVVIDGVTVDPLTPNMGFNVYFSSDDVNTSDHMDESDWETKLWTRIPASYVCTQRQQYVFPTPIMAKYMKLEFTNLQAQSYNPGQFQKPITYRKFPTWVASYFVAQMELPSFVASHVQVEYDALRFAYDYYLDDLDQSPDVPNVPPPNVVPQLTDYFNTNASVGVDAVTLSKINLVMNSFVTPLGTNVDQTSTLGSFVSSLMNSSNAPPAMAEASSLDPIDYSMVSSLQRESLLFEQTLPVMYFFIPCRHSYKELSATFEYNRAYFAGVNSVTFLRNDYTIESDTPLYIESGGDAANIEFTDWVFEPEDSNWYSY